MKNFVCGALYLIVLTLSSSPVHARHPETVRQHSRERCGALGIYRVDHKDPWWCCNCSAGYFKAADCQFGKPKSTRCEVCPFDLHNSNYQTYTTTSNNLTECHQSHNKAHCDNIRNVHWQAGSTTKPSSCVCDEGYFAKPKNLMEYGCNKHSPCEEGYEPIINGSGITNTLCKPCRPGMFSNVSSATEMCKHHSKCPVGQSVKDEGNSTSDTHCSGVPNVPKVKDGTPPDWVIVLAVVMAISAPGIGIIYYFWKYGSPCRTSNENAPKMPSLPVRQTSVCINGSYDECGESHDPLICCKDEDNVDTGIQESSVKIINELSQQTPLETANGTSRVDEVVQVQVPVKVKVGESISKKVKSVVIDVLEYLDLLEDNDKAKLLTRYTGWKETIKDLAKDSNIGSIIIYGWNNIPCDVLRSVIRIFLDEVDIKDIENNHPNNSKEVRYQWISTICKTHGRRLTPHHLMSQSYEGRVFKDHILHGLVEHALEKLKPLQELEEVKE